MKWTAQRIGRALARQVFERKNLVVCPNCTWTGDEIDLLVVTPDLRVIDVEVKISRADLKADARKDKWYRRWDWKIDGPWFGRRDRAGRQRQEWPAYVWKHYYCLPADIWKPELAASLGSPASGVILMHADTSASGIYAKIVKRARPNPKADRLKPEDAVNIARLASLRMWDTYDKLWAQGEP